MFSTTSFPYFRTLIILIALPYRIKPRAAVFKKRDVHSTLYILPFLNSLSAQHSNKDLPPLRHLARAAVLPHNSHLYTHSYILMVSNHWCWLWRRLQRRECAEVALFGINLVFRDPLSGLSQRDRLAVLGHRTLMWIKHSTPRSTESNASKLDFIATSIVIVWLVFPFYRARHASNYLAKSYRNPVTVVRNSSTTKMYLVNHRLGQIL